MKSRKLVLQWSSYEDARWHGVANTLHRHISEELRPPRNSQHREGENSPLLKKISSSLAIRCSCLEGPQWTEGRRCPIPGQRGHWCNSHLWEPKAGMFPHCLCWHFIFWETHLRFAFGEELPSRVFDYSPSLPLSVCFCLVWLSWLVSSI